MLDFARSGSREVSNVSVAICWLVSGNSPQLMLQRSYLKASGHESPKDIASA